jgi:mandelate racemase
MEAIVAAACDYVMPDLMMIGGITGWTRAMTQAEAASLPMSSHISVEASVHALAVTPTAHWIEYLDLAGGILTEPCEVDKDGTITARGPGIGVTWDEAAVARFSV